MLPEVVDEAATRFGDIAAFATADGWTLTYRQLDELSQAVAAGLAARGISERDVVVLVLPSTVEYVVAYVALARLGAITAGVNPSLTAPERTALVELAGPRLVLATEALADGLASDVDVVEIAPAEDAQRVLQELRGDNDTAPFVPDDPDRDVAIVFTSGTTGTPKGAVFTNRQLTAITSIDFGAGWGGGGPMLASTQFAHVGFMTKLPWYLRSGATIHLLRRWRAADVLRVVADNQMTSIGGVPPQIALLLGVPDFDTYDLASVKTIIVGGGPSSPHLVREARERFDAAYSIRYSSTESGGVGTGTSFDAPDSEALWTVGRPRGDVEIEVRDHADHVVPPGQPGQVCLRSAAVMDRYWNDDDATAATLAGGWLHTGDLGVIEPDGCLRLVGRSKEMLIRGGYNVYPMEVEAVLSSHPAVADIVVVPRPDAVMGEIGVAVVVPRRDHPPPSLEELRAHGSGQLAGWKLPEAIRIVDALPLTAMQKVDRRALATEEADEPNVAAAKPELA